MFELCKKVEVYHIENHYHYYVGRSFDQSAVQKLGLNKLKVQPLKSISEYQKPIDYKYQKKGIQLTNSRDDVISTNSHINQTVKPEKISTNTSVSFYYPNNYIRPCFYKKVQPIRKIESLTYRKIQPKPCYEIGRSSFTEKVKSPIVEPDYNCKKPMSHTQRIQAKTKPGSVLSTKQFLNNSQFTLLKKQTSSITQSINKNLSQTKPPFLSKIQTCCTNQALSSNHITSKAQITPLINNMELRQSHENSSSKLISISKSVSSLQQTLRQRDHRMPSENQSNNKGSHIFQISLSNIFSKEQNYNELDPRRFSARDKDNKNLTSKRMSFWHDSDRKTIESRFSRQLQSPQQFDNVKVQQSFIQQNNIKQNFRTLQSNQIRKRDYILSQALQSRLGLVVSIKQYLFNDMKLIAQQIQAYQIFEKQKQKISSIHTNNQQNHDFNILQLYKVQLSGDCHILVKQPYTQLLQVKLKNSSLQQNIILRNQAKKIAQKLLTILQKYQIYATRKITTHQFVMCVQKVKIHDLSIFKHINSSMHMKIPNKQQIIAGIDV